MKEIASQSPKKPKSFGAIMSAIGYWLITVLVPAVIGGLIVVAFRHIIR